MGTHVYIDFLGERVVKDRPAQWIVDKYDGKILDLFFEDHEAALEWGMKELEVFIVK